ncbi:unnamed protein product [Trifolium pratense]|uniref:Uncharacterized protein n=1 Tax=Trifolium pratense TaxID=57577 RepID=A0ACB0K421_TRIPR|nr:unnamed protein product [Trifolium pratense]
MLEDDEQDDKPKGEGTDKNEKAGLSHADLAYRPANAGKATTKMALDSDKILKKLQKKSNKSNPLRKPSSSRTEEIRDKSRKTRLQFEGILRGREGLKEGDLRFERGYLRYYILRKVVLFINHKFHNTGRVAKQLSCNFCNANIFFHFDPNFTDNMEGDTDDEGHEEEEDDERANEYTDDEDASWKVRRAAAKCLAALMVSRPELLS